MTIYEFVMPTKLNGNQLKDELNCELVYVTEGKLVIDSQLTEAEVTAGVAAHNPQQPAPLSVSDKLAALGLTTDDLKALGL